MQFEIAETDDFKSFGKDHEAFALKGGLWVFMAMRDTRFFICRVRSYLVLGSGPEPIIHSFRHPIGTTNTPSSGRLYA